MQPWKQDLFIWVDRFHFHALEIISIHFQVDQQESEEESSDSESSFRVRHLAEFKRSRHPASSIEVVNSRTRTSRRVSAMTRNLQAAQLANELLYSKNEELRQSNEQMRTRLERLEDKLHQLYLMMAHMLIPKAVNHQRPVDTPP